MLVFKMNLHILDGHDVKSIGIKNILTKGISSLTVLVVDCSA